MVAVVVGVGAVTDAFLGEEQPSVVTLPEGYSLQPMTPGHVMVSDLKVGDCFHDHLEQTEVATVPMVDCSEPHDNEIYFEYSMSDGTYPGNEAVFNSSWLRCLEEFGAFVGIDYRDSELGTLTITPTSESWGQGDRAVLCAVYALDLSNLTGSMRDTRR